MPRRYQSTNVQFEELREGFHPSYVCRGEFGCGTPLMEVDRVRHAEWHAKVAASLVVTRDLSDMPGANDVSPLPPHERLAYGDDSL